MHKNGVARRQDERARNFRGKHAKGFEDEAYSSIMSREGSDQAQVASLKARAYKAAVESTVARYMRE